MEHCIDPAYLYDGSFAGFLCCVFEAVLRKEQPVCIRTPDSALSASQPIRHIETRPEQAQRVWQSVPSRMGTRAAALISRVFLSSDSQKELLLLHFFRLGYQCGPSVCRMVGHPDAAAVLELEQQVLNEARAYAEFMQFQRIDGILTAAIEPECFVLPLLADYFCGRFPEEGFLIADRSHQEALIGKQNRLGYMKLAGPFAPPVTERNDPRGPFQWYSFYRDLLAAVRENNALLRQHCPARYLHYAESTHRQVLSH